MLEVNKVYCQDCLEFMKQIETNSISLVVIDPPYFNVMMRDWKGNKHEWDNQWKSITEYTNWIGEIAQEIKRVLKDNGSFYIFADDKVCAYVQVELDKLFHLENSIVWVKPNNLTIKGWSGYRSYAPITERILFYSKEVEKTGLQEIYENPDCFKSIKEYMRDERKKIMEANGFKTLEQFNNYINQVSETASVVSRHYFPDSQWVFPTEEIYKRLQKKTGFFRREYEDLRREYEDLRRYFKIDNNYTDVWTFNIMGGRESLGKHPTQKPIELIKRIIKVSCREEEIVLDCFMGSGTTAVACKQLGRKFIGCDTNQEYVNLCNQRLIQNTLTKLEEKQDGNTTDGIPPSPKGKGILPTIL